MSRDRTPVDLLEDLQRAGMGNGPWGHNLWCIFEKKTTHVHEKRRRRKRKLLLRSMFRLINKIYFSRVLHVPSITVSL